MHQHNTFSLVLKRYRMMGGLKALLLVCPLLLPAVGVSAQAQRDDRTRFAPDAEVREAFEPVVESARDSVVAILVNGEERVLGSIVDASGIVLSKASELTDAEQLEAVLASGDKVAAEVAGVDRSNDLAFLTIKADGLKPLRLVEDDPGLGRWLASVGKGASPAAVGVVSAVSREIKPPRLVMGVILDQDHPKGLHVLNVNPGMGADRAGIEAGDVLVRVGGRKAIAIEQVVKRLEGLHEGDTIKVELLRGDDEKTLTVGLTELEPDPRSRSERMNRMGGEISERRRGFERVLQHDAEIRPEHCGGPVVNLRGEVVGLNIARAGRIATYALPSELLKQKLEAFKAGAFSPKAEKPQDPVALPDEAEKDAKPVNAE